MLFGARTNQHVSKVTMRRTLKKLGLQSRIPRRKPLLSETNRQKRLDFALAYRHWTQRQWRKVFFSDESTFSQFAQGRSDRVWRELSEGFHQSCVAAVKHPPNRMFWGGFSYQGLGPIVALQGSVTGAVHAETLRHVLPSMRKHFPRGDGYFQEDNAAPHRSKVAVAVREAAGIRTLPWPAQSPDLNPIENLWREMKSTVSRRTPASSSLVELEKYVKAAWKDIPPEYYKNLIDSMPRRIEAIIAANGCITKY